eukprot:jgi/Mesvir1/17096/Mv07533-RA.2
MAACRMYASAVSLSPAAGPAVVGQQVINQYGKPSGSARVDRSRLGSVWTGRASLPGVVARRSSNVAPRHSRTISCTAVQKGVNVLDWLRSEGMEEPLVELVDRDASVGNGKQLHVCITKRDVQPGEVVLRIPDRLVVTLERVFEDETLAELLTTNTLSELACLALYLMYEKKQGKESYWLPFIKELDNQAARGQNAVESPLLWKPEEIEAYLTGSPLVEDIKKRLAGIEREYQELDTVWYMAGSLFQKYPYDSPTETFSKEIFKQAFVAVQACVVHLQGVNLAKRFALVPLGPPLINYKSNCRAVLQHTEDNHVELRADRPYKKGEPMSVWCGPQPNQRLLQNYGIVDDDNPFDRLAVQIALDTEDPLYQRKRLLVQKSGMSTIQSFNLGKGKEEETIEKMLAYMRLSMCNTVAECEAVDLSVGPICPSNPCAETVSISRLMKYFKKRLDAYKYPIEHDHAVVGWTICGCLTVCRRWTLMRLSYYVS